MNANRELHALFTLIDDPDLDVFARVEERLVSYGNPVIPELEHLWEQTISEAVQDRIEMIIHRIHVKGLEQEFGNWLKGDRELLHGALLVAKFLYPELQTVKTLQDFEKIRRNLWLEMNTLLTPIEQVKVMESILYNYYKLQGSEVNYARPEDFALNKVIERKKGNALSNAVLYISLCEKLDIPVRAIRIPSQFVMGYFAVDALFTVSTEDKVNAAEKIKFFIDPNSGIGFSHKDVAQYYQRMNLKPANRHFRPLQSADIIVLLLQELSNCFNTPENAYKKAELLAFADMLLRYA